MEEEWFQERGKISAQNVKEVISLGILHVLNLILKELKLLRKDLKK